MHTFELVAGVWVLAIGAGVWLLAGIKRYSRMHERNVREEERRRAIRRLLEFDPYQGSIDRNWRDQ